MSIIFHEGKNIAKILSPEGGQVKCHSELCSLSVGEVLGSEVCFQGLKRKVLKEKELVVSKVNRTWKVCKDKNEKT